MGWFSHFAHKVTKTAKHAAHAMEHGIEDAANVVGEEVKHAAQSAGHVVVQVEHTMEDGVLDATRTLGRETEDASQLARDMGKEAKKEFIKAGNWLEEEEHQAAKWGKKTGKKLQHFEHTAEKKVKDAWHDTSKYVAKEGKKIGKAVEHGALLGPFGVWLNDEVGDISSFFDRGGSFALFAILLVGGGFVFVEVVWPMLKQGGSEAARAAPLLLV
jgi:hypothetical protein